MYNVYCVYNNESNVYDDVMNIEIWGFIYCNFLKSWKGLELVSRFQNHSKNKIVSSIQKKQ